jgi:hypothetical protein
MNIYVISLHGSKLSIDGKNDFNVFEENFGWVRSKVDQQCVLHTKQGNKIMFLFERNKIMLC